MLPYLGKRILVFIPTMFFVSLLAFLISTNAPGDPVEILTRTVEAEGEANQATGAEQKVKAELRTKLGLDLPIFYIGIGTMADCDTIFKFEDGSHQEALQSLARSSGAWDQVSEYYWSLRKEKDLLSALRKDTTLTSAQKDTRSDLLFAINALMETGNADKLPAKLKVMDSLSLALNHPRIQLNGRAEWEKVVAASKPWKKYVPAIRLNGFENQYHNWLLGDLFTSRTTGRKGVLRGDFGLSYYDSQPVSDKIWDKFWTSFILIFLSIVLAYIVSVPIGIYAAYKKGGWFDKTSGIVLFVLYSVPSYFAGTLLLYLFANPDVLYWFPESGLYDPVEFDESWGFFKKLVHQTPYYFLPLICYTYGSFAFLSRIMRVGMIDVMNQDFVRTARAKGLSERKVILKHVLRNSLIPLITVFANVFPAAVGGSVILEMIFSIEGMGKQTYDAIFSYDYPIIIAIFTLSGGLTVIGYLVADLLYAIVDPRISLK